MWFVKKIIFFILGGAAYQLIELLWRGFTHPSMFVAGGLCFIAIDSIYKLLGKKSLILAAVVCGIAITAVELIIGSVVNIGLGLQVWDYSNVPFNFMGQICLLYSVMWMALSIPAMYLCKLSDRILAKIIA